MARLFNAYLIVHWSAAGKPTTGTDSVWVGVLKRDVRFRFAFEAHNPPTRAKAEELIAGILDDRAKRRERTFVGLDFPLGFPAGLAAGLNLPGETPWRAVWDQLAKMVKDKADNTNNRFGVGSEINRRLTGGPFPFWGCTPKDALTTLQPKRTRAHGPGDLAEFRHIDQMQKPPGSIWKLYYNGSIGGPAILGIPLARRLKLARGEKMKVWPFESGFKALTENDLEGVDALVAEVTLAGSAGTSVPGEAKEVAQLRAFTEALSRLDDAGKLSGQFAPPAGTSEETVQVATIEEGWALAV